ncbi:MAG TPA: PIN domain-containing protein, partial [Gemmatimonadaceae bacterium]|nr:PIN domain-containing protein [Gemmatimonadaceae bacterium]
LDSSCVVAIATGERSARPLAERLERFDRIFAAPLLEAEVRSVLQREGLAGADVDLSDVRWILPSRPLTDEIERVLEAGYVRGADCWHLACALYLAPEPGEVTFLTLDTQQRRVAKALGFDT